MSERGVHNSDASVGSQPVAVLRNGPFVWVTLSRPQKANALDKASIRALLAALDDAEADPARRAIALWSPIAPAA